MSLQITQSNGIYYLNGSINPTTAKGLQSHLEVLIYPNKTVTINIDNVTEIDESGVAVLKSLHTHFLHKNGTFLISGKGAKEIYAETIFANIA